MNSIPYIRDKIVFKAIRIVCFLAYCFKDIPIIYSCRKATISFKTIQASKNFWGFVVVNERPGFTVSCLGKQIRFFLHCSIPWTFLLRFSAARSSASTSLGARNLERRMLQHRMTFGVTRNVYFRNATDHRSIENFKPSNPTVTKDESENISGYLLVIECLCSKDKVSSSSPAVGTRWY